MIAYYCGKFLDAEDISISVFDRGFTMGATVTERLRTFHGKALFVEQHLDRLRAGLNTVGIELPGEFDLRDLIDQVIARNRKLFDEQDDLDINVFATPGISDETPTLGIVALPVRFQRWAAKYRKGEHLVTSLIRETTNSNWPKTLKCRSRMHYWLAEREVAESGLSARPLLLDHAGKVAESTTAMIAAVVDGSLIAPPQNSILPSISFEIAQSFLNRNDVNICRKPMEPERLNEATEILSFSSLYLVLPVVQIDGSKIGEGIPGPVFKQLLNEFGNYVGFDIVRQAERFSNRDHRVPGNQAGKLSRGN